MQPGHPSRFVHLSAVLIVATAIVGYFVGLQSPMNPADKIARFQSERARATPPLEQHLEMGAIPATAYSDIGKAVRAIVPRPGGSPIDDARGAGDAQGENSQTARSSVPEKTGADQAEIPQISMADKRFALAMRQRNRAYNGAPPTVPHPISEMSAETCVACHVDGSQTATLRIPKMSHQFLSNCTQCHVATAPHEMPNALVRANHFVGLTAPEGGPRAYAGAPPQIPHSTWMRVDCLSCHGLTSHRGLQTTHPWRTNCQQCHTPSSTAEQSPLESDAQFISPLQVD